jgi:Flp pilus assembly pilin Flp
MTQAWRRVVNPKEVAQLPKRRLVQFDPQFHSSSSSRSREVKSHMTFRTWIDALRTREEGQTMAEYGVVLGVITIAAVGAFLALGGRIDDAINAVVALLP